MNIYTTIPPTRLYIKQHSITKLKYFGKTTEEDPIKYKGSGKRWLRHIKKHGSKFVETLWLSDPYFDTSIREPALHFSCENNIDTTPTVWANLMPEDGLTGSATGRTNTQESKDKMAASAKGRTASQETKDKMTESRKGKTASQETKDKIGAASKGRALIPFLSLIHNKKTFARCHISKWHPEFKQYY
jgi:hypothetical protein